MHRTYPPAVHLSICNTIWFMFVFACLHGHMQLRSLMSWTGKNVCCPFKWLCAKWLFVLYCYCEASLSLNIIKAALKKFVLWKALYKLDLTWKSILANEAHINVSVKVLWLNKIYSMQIFHSRWMCFGSLWEALKAIKFHLLLLMSQIKKAK